MNDTPSEIILKKFDALMEECLTLKRENQMLKNENGELKQKLLQRSQCFVIPKHTPK